MTDKNQTEVIEFQAEAKQLLRLMTHSLYSNREIFLRELISNASDACDKLRFESMDNPELMEQQVELRIRIDIDKKSKLLIISDNGIGMSREEIIDNLGTIARSGTARFLENLSGDRKKDSALIGQFGVGFYSAFIVADQVEVYSRRAGLPPEQGVHWRSSGEANYELEPCELNERGTRVVLHLKKDAAEFLEEWTVRGIIKKYCDHITLPVQMKASDGKSGEDKAEYQAVNSVQALWTRPRSDISDQEYQSFYKHIAHDFDDPLMWSHNAIEGKLSYISLLYIPKRALFDLWQREAPRGLKLYVRRTFILDNAEQFLPLYLRFIKGVVDCNDLPLNVSRELLQHSPQVEKIKAALTKRALDMLKKLGKNPKDYQQFWQAFGQVLKEGCIEDPGNSDKIAELLRFASTQSGDAAQTVSLDDYIQRMPEGQDKIYYLIGESHALIGRSPLLEKFRKQGREVLLLSDRIDEWLMSHLREYQGKSFQDIARGELEEMDDSAQAPDKADHSDLTRRIADYLGERASQVRVSRRLVDSPACLVLEEFEMSPQMRKIMQAAGQTVTDTAPVFEINPQHPLIVKIRGETDDARFGDLVELAFGQAYLGAGENLPDPVGFVQRLNKLLLEPIG